MTDELTSNPDDLAPPSSERPTLVTPIGPALANAAQDAANEDAGAVRRTIPYDDLITAHESPSSPPPSKKPRSKMTLRIPDDEVARPSETPDPPASTHSSEHPHPSREGAARESAAPPIPPSRIISVLTPTAEIQVTPLPKGGATARSTDPGVQSDSSPPPAVHEGIVRRAGSAPPEARLAELEQEDSWTPYQPTAVEAVEKEVPPPPDSFDIPIDSSEEPESSEPATPPRKLPPVSAPPLAYAAPVSPVPVENSHAIHPEVTADAEPSTVPSARDGSSHAPSVPPLPPVRPRATATVDPDELALDPSLVDDAEISAEDVVSIELAKSQRGAPSVPVPPMRPRATSNPGFSSPPSPPLSPSGSMRAAPKLGTQTIKTTTVPPEVPQASTPPRPPPLVIVPAASPLAPPPMSDTVLGGRKRVRPWWEDLFNDDFIRTMAKLTDRQVSREVDFIEDSLGLDKGAMVLDLACGTGRHAIELTRRGYQVVGFDLSLAMLAKAADEAQDRQQKINFVQGDMREMTFEDTFDGIYSWSTSFGYFEEEKNAHVAANIHRALKPGGQLLLDVVNRDYVARQSPSMVWFEGDGCVCMDDMSVDWITSRMKVKRTMMMDDGRSKEIEYSIRIYSLHELGKLLHDNGFRVAQVSGRIATPGVFLGADSPRTFILAEKK